MERRHKPPIDKAGLAIAVVDQHGFSFKKGYGLADRNEPKKCVDTSTSFLFGSATKPFTSGLVVLMAQDGLLKLDAPLKSLDCGFELSDPDASADLTLEDLLTHRSGMPAHDGLWYLTKLSRSDLYDRLRYLDRIPNLHLEGGPGFHYNNLMYAAIGSVLEQMCRNEWGDLMTDHLLGPLALHGLATSHRQIARSNFAKPYLYYQGHAQELIVVDVDNIAPAAALSGSVDDLIPWLEMLARGGKRRDGTSVFRSETFRNWTTPRTPIGPGSRRSYALGWFTETIGNLETVYHTGNCDGYGAYIGYAAGLGVAIAVLTNEHTFPGPASPRSSAERVAVATLRYLSGEPDEPPTLVPIAPLPTPNPGAPARCPEHQTGEYTHPAYGSVHLENTAHSARIRFFNRIWPLTKTRAGGWWAHIDAFGASYAAQVLLVDTARGDDWLLMGMEPRVGWTRFRRAGASN